MNEPKRQPLVPASKAMPKLRDPWLVAAWPGMGTVAALAAHHLLQSLGAQPLALIPEHEFFSIDHVQVHQGIARSGPLPRNMFFVWRDPEQRHDLLIFLGEAQPPSGGYQLCQRIIQLASKFEIQRVVTFAAMATHLNPKEEPRVFGAVTAPQLLDEIRVSGVDLLSDGQISGLNGALLAAAAEKQIPAVCLLGEMPFFAVSVPNPKSSLAVINVFSELIGISVNTEQLVEQARVVEPQLTQLFEQVRHQIGPDDLTDDADFDIEADDSVDVKSDAPDRVSSMHDVAVSTMSDHDRTHIESLFAKARQDRTCAEKLKQELDRLGVFSAFEDCFLDLFRKPGD